MRPLSGLLITGPQACALVGVSRWTWRRYVTNGCAPAPVSGLPGLPKWRRADVERFAAGTFRSPGRRTYFLKSRHLHDEQVAQGVH